MKVRPIAILGLALGLVIFLVGLADWSDFQGKASEGKATGNLAGPLDRPHPSPYFSRYAFCFMAGLVCFSGGLAVFLLWKSERLARERSRFTASAAHELRTPLANLRMYGEMLAGDLGDPGKARVYAQRMAHEAERMGRIVSNILNFTSLEHGPLKVPTSPGDLPAAVQEEVARCRPVLEVSGVNLKVECEGPVPLVGFDREAVHLILQNFLDNAEKYSRDSGSRTIQVKVGRMEGGNGVFLSVLDRGPGVPKERAPLLFRPFYRDPSPQTPPGLGLGLATARVLARAQGGEVFFRENPAGGSIFTLILPL